MLCAHDQLSHLKCKCFGFKGLTVHLAIEMFYKGQFGDDWSTSPRLLQFNAFQVSTYVFRDVSSAPFKVETSPIAFKCHWKTWFNVTLLAYQECADVSHRPHVNIIANMWKC